MSWQTVALAAINMLQIILLAYINRKTTTIERNVNSHLQQHMDSHG